MDFIQAELLAVSEAYKATPDVTGGTFDNPVFSAQETLICLKTIWKNEDK